MEILIFFFRGDREIYLPGNANFFLGKTAGNVQKYINWQQVLGLQNEVSTSEKDLKEKEKLIYKNISKGEK